MKRHAETRGSFKSLTGSVRQGLVRISRSVYRYRVLILCVVLPLLVATLFRYDDQTTSADLLGLGDRFNWVFRFSNSGISFYVSLITAITLVFVIVQWMQAQDSTRRANINGLLEELKHNLGLSSYPFVVYEVGHLYQNLYYELQSLGGISVYPNPTDSEETRRRLFSYLKPESDRVRMTGALFLPLRNDFLSSVASTSSVFDLKNHRIFINLGHLDYSIRRYNYFLATSGMDSLPTFVSVRDEFLNWVFFRLHFLLLDLVDSIDEVDVIDKEFFQTLKNRIG